MVAYLCCELTARDLDSRLLIASHLLAAKVPVVVGQMWSIWANLREAPTGVALFSTANMVQAKEMALAKQYGHIVLDVLDIIMSLFIRRYFY